MTEKKKDEKIKQEKIIPFTNEVAVNVFDMIKLEDISEIDLLNNIKNRFLKKNTFTNVGQLLISINPYQNMEQYFSEDKMNEILKINKKGEN